MSSSIPWRARNSRAQPCQRADISTARRLILLNSTKKPFRTGGAVSSKSWSGLFPGCLGGFSAPPAPHAWGCRTRRDAGMGGSAQTPHAGAQPTCSPHIKGSRTSLADPSLAEWFHCCLTQSNKNHRIPLALQWSLSFVSNQRGDVLCQVSKT